MPALMRLNIISASSFARQLADTIPLSGSGRRGKEAVQRAVHHLGDDRERSSCYGNAVCKTPGYRRPGCTGTRFTEPTVRHVLRTVGHPSCRLLSIR